MFNSISHKNKLILLIVFIILVIFIFAKTGLKQTKTIRQEITELSQETFNLENELNQLSTTIAKIKTDSSLLSFIQNTSKPEQNIYQMTSTYLTENPTIDVYALETPITHQTNSIKTTTYGLHFTGDFKSGLKLAYFLEHDYAYGRISNLNFHFTRDAKTRKRIFIISIYYQISQAYEKK